jgi:uncharacterized Zn finger protein
MPWWYDDYERKPRKPADGIKAKSGRGKIGATWWAGRWIAALEKLVDSGRLSRGRSYARSGQVLNLDIATGSVKSKVQGSRATPYKVTIQIKPLDDRAWQAVIDAMAEQAIFAAKLLAGEMPQNIEEAFAAAKFSLFPANRNDLITDCSCPDYSNPCKHIAAVYYLLGERFDEDPFLIFELRGRNKEQIMSALRAKRSIDAPESEIAAPAPQLVESTPVEELAPPLEEYLDRFWSMGEGVDLQQMRFTIVAPPVEAAQVKRLGKPPFWSGDDFAPTISHAYAQITNAALETVFGTTKDGGWKAR